MATNSTTSNYISKINQNYPTAGQNNDSNGFRNNFKNIKSALTYADQDINYLKLNSVKLTETNDFNNTTNKRIVLQNSSVLIYDNTDNVETDDVVLDYTNGSYQKYSVSGGTHVFTVSNWPTGARSGSLILSVIAGVDNAYINFNSVNLVSLGPDTLPMILTANTEQFFQLWCDGNSDNLYVRGLGNGNSSTSTSTDLVATSLTINDNTYTTGQDESTQYVTTVKANNRIANLALVPNQVKVRITDKDVMDRLGDLVARTFPVSTTAGVMLGGTVDFPEVTNAATFTVTSFTPSTITVTPAFAVNSITSGTYVTITNPGFTEQPTVVTLKPTAITTTTSVGGDLKGQIYANQTSLYVTYNDHSYGTINKIKVSSDDVLKAAIMVTQPIETDSTALASTAFVHNIMPRGSIIMWYGSVATVPTGWRLCNGENGTPDLRDRFVVGADGSYAVGATGGAKDAVVVSHSHTAASTVSDPTHNHTFALYGMNGGGGNGGGDLNDTRPTNYNTAAAATGITVATTIDSAGVSGANANLPPYHALCYIMKVTG